MRPYKNPSGPPAMRMRPSGAESQGTGHGEEATGRCDLNAAHLRDSVTSMFLFASTNDILSQFQVADFRRYRDGLVADCGDPRDPVEVMLVEQLALAHMNIGQLFYKASASGSAECATAYLAAATRLMAELRRTALALPAYRAAARRLDDREDGPGNLPEETDHDSGIEGGRRDVPPGRSGARAGVGRVGDPRSA